MVYLIHFDQKLKHAQHYIGFCYDNRFKKRISHHRNNTGAPILRALNKAGIGWSVVRTWPNEDGNFERKLKNQKKASCLCPICKSKNLPEQMPDETKVAS